MSQQAFTALNGRLRENLGHLLRRYLIDRLAALIPDSEEVEYVHSTLRIVNTGRGSATGQLAVWTTSNVYLQEVTRRDSGAPHLRLQVLPRAALTRLEVDQEIALGLEMQSDPPVTDGEWPWMGQLTVHYDGYVGAPVRLPDSPGHRPTVEPFRAFLPSLLKDLQARR